MVSIIVAFYNYRRKARDGEADASNGR